jgi:hypothetical protein
MSDLQVTKSTARWSRIFGSIAVAALLILASRQYIWGEFALLTGAIWMAYYYTRFATPPEDVADAKNGVVLLGLLAVGLLATDIMQREQRTEFISSLENLCSDVPDNDERWEKCDELLELIEGTKTSGIEWPE